MHSQLQNPESLSDLCSMYLHFNCRLERATRELTLRTFKYLIEAAGDIALKEFGYRQAEFFQIYIVNSGRKKVTANIYIKTARPVFRWAMRNGWIAEDPFENLKIFKVPEEEIRIYDQREFAALLNGCRSRLWQARILLAKCAGLRRGEILNLIISDIDFERGIIIVQPKKEERYTWRWVPKNKKIRKVPLPESVSKFLIDFVMVDIPEKQPYLMISNNRYQRIQDLRTKGILSARIRECPDENFSKPWDRIRRRANILDGTFHDLRRTCITEWLENGLQPHEVRELAGHSSIETTMRYYVATRACLLDKARAASQKVIGATGLEPATS